MFSFSNLRERDEEDPELSSCKSSRLELSSSLLEPTQPAGPSLWKSKEHQFHSATLDREADASFVGEVDIKPNGKSPDSKSLPTENLRPKKRKVDLATEEEALEESLKTAKPELAVQVKVEEPEADVTIRKKPRIDAERNQPLNGRSMMQESNGGFVSNGLLYCETRSQVPKAGLMRCVGMDDLKLPISLPLCPECCGCS